MKICIATTGYHFNLRKGGAELQSYLLYKHFIKEGHKVYYVYNRSNEKEIVTDDEVDFLTIDKPLKSINFLNWNKIRGLLKEIDVDVYYQRGLEYNNIFQRVAAQQNKLFILGVSMETQCYNNYPGFNKMFGVNLIKKYLNSSCIKNADLIISQTNKQKELLEQNFSRESVVIPNGHPIPLPPFEKSIPPIVTWIANIKELKQPEIFIKLAEECRDLNANFIYAGRPGVGNYHQMLMSKTEKLSNLSYLGEISFEESNELLAKSSLLVNTSLTEGFSNTYIQAWMRETPVVTLNCDPDDLIKKYKMGYHSGSFDQLIKDVRYMIEKEDIRIQMGKIARSHAVENYDIEKTGDEHLSLFQKHIELKKMKAGPKRQM